MGLFISHSPAETESLGQSWGEVARPGWVIGLSGDLGAGKTQLVRGLARGVGTTERVQSPTFALVNVYTGGRLTLYHLDLYRLETRAQILSAGLDEYLRPSGITVIEWAERWFDIEKLRAAPAALGTLPVNPVPPSGGGAEMPPLLRWTVIETLSEADRRITYEDFGL